MGGLPPLPFELRRGVLAAPEPAGALAGWTSNAHIAVAIPDHTRSLPIQQALSELTERIPNHQFIVGLGLHRSLSPQEMTPLQRWKPVQHDPDDCAPTMSIMGIPGGVSRHIAEADWSLTLGVCELHQYAGLSGGHKGVSVGCGSRETITALHHRDRVLAPGVEVGQIDGNPFREAIDLLGRAAGCHLALNWVPSVGLWMAGPPEKVIREALARARPWQMEKKRAAGARIRVPESKARSLYQASRAATYLALSPAPPLEDGAILALEATCEEGLGSEAGFVQILEAHPPPWSGCLHEELPQGAGAQRALMLAQMARRYQLRIYGCLRPETFTRLGIWASSDPAPCPDNWLDLDAPFTSLPQLAPDA